MARLTILLNPLALDDRREAELEPGERPIDWLQKHYPDGCGGGLRWWVNGAEQVDDDGAPLLDNLDMVPEPDDVIVLAAIPQWAAIGIAILTSVIISALTLAVTMLFMKKPTAPAFAQPNTPDSRQPSTVYDIRAQANAARIGEPIPVIYGQVLTTPDYACAPHVWYEADNSMWLDSLFVIGQGTFTIQEILLGDTNVDLLNPGVLWWTVAPPSRHGMTQGNLGFFSNFYENIVTCSEVNGQEFSEGAQTVGFFRLSKTGIRGRYITYDLEWPAGLFQENTWGGGGITAATVEWVFIVRDLDNNVQREFPWFEGRFFDNDPVRMTYWVDMGYSGSFAVALVRLTGRNTRHVDRFKWTGAKLWGDYSAPPVYGDVTLLAVRMKASAGIGDGQQQIRVRCTRQLPWGGVGAAGATRNAADALIDIYCNTVYGARRPLSEVDTVKLTQLRAIWDGYHFDAVYDGSTTVWQALSQAIQGMAAAPLPLGSFLSVAQDGIKPARSMLYSEQNIARDSFNLVYDFDKVGAHDGVEVEYRETANFSPAYVRIPGNSVDPDKTVLFGCTDPNHASQFAMLLWNRRHMQRKSANWETELEGLIPYPGERIAISHTLPKWGISGYVALADAAALVLTLDRELPWAETPPPYVMAFRTQDGGMSSIVGVRSFGLPNQVRLDSWPLRPDGSPLVFSIGDRQENTHFVFGTSTNMVRDFVLTEIRPRGGVRVELVGVVYNPSVFIGAMSFLQNPVP